MRKRGMVTMAALALTVCVGAATAFAAAPGRNYTDANGDGICDFAGERTCVCQRRDADGDGICDFQSRCGHQARGWRGGRMC